MKICGKMKLNILSEATLRVHDLAKGIPPDMRDAALIAQPVKAKEPWRLHLRPPAARAVCTAIAVLGAASIAGVAAQPCAPNDFSCWDRQPDPIDMYARLEEDLRTLEWGGCPAVCSMTAEEIHVASATAALVGGIFVAFRRAPGIAGKIVAIGVAAFGAYAAMQTKEFITLAKNRCIANSCATEPLW